MRVSVRKDDCGYSANAYDCKVFLDDVKIENCFTADEELGIAYCFKVDENGNLIVDPKGRDCAVEIERHGNVRVVPHS